MTEIRPRTLAQTLQRAIFWSVCAAVPALVAHGCGKNKSSNPVNLGPISQDMVLIHSGTYRMGSPTTEKGRGSDETEHPVGLTRPCYLLSHEVTQGEWQSVMGNNPSFFHGSTLPVDNVSWMGAVEFCIALSRTESLAPAYEITPDSVIWHREAPGYRLPTEAEWERACRAGTTTSFYNGEIQNSADDCDPDAGLESVAWYCANFHLSTHEVGGKAANAWDLHDMLGNVWEWCWDLYGPYPSAWQENPAGPKAASGDSLHVLRGGAWSEEARFCRCASRLSLAERTGNNSTGFRVARNAALSDSDSLATTAPPVP